jgi:hypothetical protein
MFSSFEIHQYNQQGHDLTLHTTLHTQTIPLRLSHHSPRCISRSSPEARASSTITITMLSPLLALPAELRIALYTHVFSTITIHSSNSWPYTRPPLHILALPLTCSQLHFETSLLPYKNFTFSFVRTLCGGSGLRRGFLSKWWGGSGARVRGSRWRGIGAWTYGEMIWRACTPIYQFCLPQHRICTATI